MDVWDVCGMDVMFNSPLILPIGTQGEEGRRRDGGMGWEQGRGGKEVQVEVAEADYKGTVCVFIISYIVLYIALYVASYRTQISGDLPWFV